MNEDAMKSEDSITFAQLIVHDNGLEQVVVPVDIPA